MSGYWECPEHGHRRAYLFEASKSCPTCEQPMVHDTGRARPAPVAEAWQPLPLEEQEQLEAGARASAAAELRREQRIKARRAGMAANIARRGVDADRAVERVDATFTLEGEWVKTCTECHREFRSKRSDAVTCSPRCRRRRARRPSL